MKKVLVVFLMIFVAAGAFAQVTAEAQLRTNFGFNMPLDDFDMDNNNWAMDIANGGTWVGARYRGENVTGWLRWRAGPGAGTWRGDATVQLGDVALSVGINELPFSRFSGFLLFGDSNAGIGASNSTGDPYVMLKTHGFYVGLSQAGRGGFIPGNALTGRATFDNNPMPGVFLGYDLRLDGGVTLGFAFACIITGADNDFSFMGSIFARFTDLGPATLGVNAAIYMNPSLGFFGLATPAAAFAPVTRGGEGEDPLVLEAMLDLAVPVDNLTINFSVGYVMNFETEYMGMQAGLGVRIPVAPRFLIIPGLRYRTTFGDNLGLDNLLVGATFQYSF